MPASMRPASSRSLISRVHAISLLVDDTKELTDLGRLQDAPIPQHRGARALDGCQRRAQFVAHHPQEISSHPVERLRINRGHVERTTRAAGWLRPTGAIPCTRASGKRYHSVVRETRRDNMRYVIAILAGVVLLPAPAAAQTPERTPWGDPDLQWGLDEPDHDAARASERVRGAGGAHRRGARGDRRTGRGGPGPTPAPGPDRRLQQLLARPRRAEQSDVAHRRPARRAVPGEDGSRAGERRRVRGHARRHAVRHVA